MPFAGCTWIFCRYRYFQTVNNLLILLFLETKVVVPLSYMVLVCWFLSDKSSENYETKALKIIYL
jgi:hypothetical protein